MKSKQSGFTLVEIAIVLVIIGLLLGGVLKGQELINSAKVKNFAGDIRNISTFIYAYQDPSGHCRVTIRVLTPISIPPELWAQWQREEMPASTAPGTWPPSLTKQRCSGNTFALPDLLRERARFRLMRLTSTTRAMPTADASGLRATRFSPALQSGPQTSSSACRACKAALSGNLTRPLMMVIPPPVPCGFSAPLRRT
jgi:prepilin-type N-terminal cleavage/methylation domain-containing protein